MAKKRDKKAQQKSISTNCQSINTCTDISNIVDEDTKKRKSKRKKKKKLNTEKSYDITEQGLLKKDQLKKSGRPSTRKDKADVNCTSYYIAGCLDPFTPEKDVIFNMFERDNQANPDTFRLNYCSNPKTMLSTTPCVYGDEMSVYERDF
jgi:hypothetical protein